MDNLEPYLLKTLHEVTHETAGFSGVNSILLHHSEKEPVVLLVPIPG